MEKVAVFPGTFDPFTVGHEAIVQRALPLFDRIIVAVGMNITKKTLFSVEQRVSMINDVFSSEGKVEVMSFEGLTVDFCTKIGAKYLLRGLRTAADFEYERAIGQVNKAMKPDIESVFLLTSPEHTPVNSTIVRDILVNGGDASKFIPASINIKKYLNR
ncbi:MAG TPA: pantetheine-phosphate adenylyltransferase [Tenuifilaceae bacterium]|nr:pantetheine-phosphate adenylyltransferase [Tenuifilaceae bacterium]HPE18594.1 pantetheine-phosphate adenylyltransferase [Tenuifilaceae bacterium]HPJ46035.1 pantetheine-phosphate adenylyltransferase [Tenuifilaceae bacterium]HPQ34738.1 pantetheine-phosphate adenylyltransferase [Tenuifilaceae bacterium]HRX67367.1 pantetheine-phosphate adenylyltransferase [Tenuifilaceae bacterium]